MSSDNDIEFLLICATGRSGSTTLQRIINAIPGYNIFGENNNFIINIIKCLESLDYSNFDGNNNMLYSDYVKNNIKPCWYNYYDKDIIKNNLKNIIKIFLNYGKYKVVGFKEIRYNKDNIYLIEEFIKIFPNTKVIIHYKNDINTQSKSSWFADNPNSSTDLKEMNELFNNFYEKNKHTGKFYLSTFEELFNHDFLYQLYKFLNQEDNFNPFTINEILNNNQG